MFEYSYNMYDKYDIIELSGGRTPIFPVTFALFHRRLLRWDIEKGYRMVALVIQAGMVKNLISQSRLSCFPLFLVPGIPTVFSPFVRHNTAPQVHSDPCVSILPALLETSPHSVITQGEKTLWPTGAVEQTPFTSFFPCPGCLAHASSFTPQGSPFSRLKL